jgi:hypothetical protein
MTFEFPNGIFCPVLPWRIRFSIGTRDILETLSTMSDLTVDAAIKTGTTVENQQSESESDSNTESSSESSTSSEDSNTSESTLKRHKEKVEDPEVQNEYRRLL